MTDPAVILVIDHDPTGGVATTATLHAQGFQVELETMPAAALGRLANRRVTPVVAVVITATLTGMGATRLARAIRTLPAYGRIPLVILGTTPLEGGDPPGSLRATDLQKLSGIVGRLRTPDAGANSGRVLVVDDNQVNRILLTRIVSGNGYEVEQAEDGLQALTMASRERFALIFMDCEMPRMDGFEATRAIRRVDAQRGSHTPIVACTARSLAGDRELGLASGMDDYLIKPVPIEAIEAQLARWLVAAPAAAQPAPAKSSGIRPAVASPSTPRPGSATASVTMPDPADEPLLDHLVLDRIRGYGGAVLQVTTDQFLGELPTRIAELATLHAASDHDSLGKRAHALKGSAGSLGARRLWRTLVAIEAAARSGDQTALAAIMPGLSQLAEDGAGEMRAYLAANAG